MAAINILHDDENTTRHSSLSRSIHRKTQGQVTSKVFQSQSNDVSATPRRAFGDIGNLKHSKLYTGKDPISAKKLNKNIKTNDTSLKVRPISKSNVNIRQKGSSVSVLDNEVFSAKPKQEVLVAKQVASENEIPLEKETMHPYVEEEEELELPDFLKILTSNKCSLRGFLPSISSPSRPVKPYSFSIEDFIKEHNKPNIEPIPSPDLPSLLTGIFHETDIDDLNEQFPLDPINIEAIPSTDHNNE